MNDHQRQNRLRLLEILSKIPASSSPAGWRQTGTFAVGGLTEIGFAQHAELLLVVSSNGRGVIDCGTGQRIARDDEDGGSWYDTSNLQCAGVGPLEGATIAIAGLHGGGLPTINRYGESLHVVAPDWPTQDVVFCASAGDPFIEGRQSDCTIVVSGIDIRAYGFSWSGNVLAVATSSDLWIFTKNSPA